MKEPNHILIRIGYVIALILLILSIVFRFTNQENLTLELMGIGGVFLLLSSAGKMVEDNRRKKIQ